MDRQTRAVRRRRFTGHVASVAGAETVMVEVSKRVLHRVYKKFITKRVKYMAHDQAGGCGVGDLVTIEECRPLSARKRWRVVKTLEKAPQVAAHV